MRYFKSVPTPATILSIIALLVALGGTATAASIAISSSSQIKNGVVKSSDIHNGTIKKVDLGKKLKKLIANGGQNGGNGQNGQNGQNGISRAFYAYKDAPVDLLANETTLASLTLKPGSYTLQAKAYLFNYTPNNVGVTCKLTWTGAGNDEDLVFHTLRPGGRGTAHQAAITVDKTTDVELNCKDFSNGTEVKALESRLTATQVDDLTIKKQP
jgi:hypothetical protein